VRIAVVTIGTRGDVQPFLALARGLQARGHDVWVCSADKYEADARAHGLRFAVSGKWRDDRHEALMRAVLAEPNPVRHLGIIFEHAREDIISVLPAVVEATQPADVIVSHVVALSGYVAAERHRKPLITGHLFDGTIPSRTLSPFGRDLGPLNRAAWALAGLIIRRTTDKILNEALRAGGLKEQRDLLLSSTHSRLLNLVAVSGEVCSLSPYGDRPYEVTGPWLLDGAAEAPAAALAEFVAAGPPPVVLTFGSMMGFDAASWTRQIVDGLQGRRAVLQAGWARLGEGELPANVFVSGPAPHDWLLPRAACVVHHGGAGTTSAVMRAGVPSSVVWFLGDQPTWGQRIAKLGVGTRPISFRELDARWLDRTLTRLSEPSLRERAQALAVRLKAEDGVARAVAAIERVAPTASG
jgi:UDP:flavonoid glycosyltransferase YjiC (YdhE family)